MGEHRLCKAGVEGSIPFVSIFILPVAVVICGVLGLKAVDERAGFLAGDAVLAAAALDLRETKSPGMRAATMIVEATDTPSALIDRLYARMRLS